MKKIGRPKKPEGVRKQRHILAYDDEWKIIHQFSNLVKYGNKNLSNEFIQLLEKSINFKKEGKINE